ncbi:MAG: hypothetical protein WAU69_03040 [Solirubrobacteraceae bacterium]
MEARSGADAGTPALRRASQGVTAAEAIGGSAEELQEFGRDLLATAKKARRAAERAIAAGKTTGVRDLTVAVGVMIDQAAKLEAAAERLREGEVQASEEQLENLVLRLRGFAVEAGIDLAMSPYAQLLQRWFNGPAPEVAVSPARSLPALEEKINDAEVMDDGV